MTSNNPRYKKLEPADLEFYEQVNSRITGSHALPFEIPHDAFFRTTIAAMKWFWNWHGDATQEQMLYIPYQTISEISSSNTSGSGNIDLLLPESIEAIIDWKASSQSITGKLANYLRISLLQTYSTSANTNGGSYGNNSNPTLSNAVISMYEASMYKETFQKGIRASFNKNTRIFRIMSSVTSGIVLQCMVRLHPQDLYGDIVFEDYVVARIEEQLGRIVTAFDFKLPGSVTINYDQIKEYGKESRKEIEADIKASNNNDTIQYK